MALPAQQPPKPAQTPPPPGGQTNPAAQNSGQAAPPATTPAKFQESTVDQVLANVAKLQSEGELKLPGDYSAENAVRSAWLMIQEVVNLDKKPALDVCTKHSIANAMLDMVLQGLSPVKKQCYFIVYGTKLQLSRSYIGTLAVARRIAGVADVVANVVYGDDEFEYEIDAGTGRKKVIKHVQQMENIDMGKIRGVYATVSMADGSSYVEIMTMPQVRAAWAQGKAKGTSPAHINFPDEMAKKSCIGRALKLLIGGTDDSALFDDDEPGDLVAATVTTEIKANGNRTAISMGNPPPKATPPTPKREYTQPEPEPAQQADQQQDPVTDEEAPY